MWNGGMLNKIDTQHNPQTAKITTHGSLDLSATAARCSSPGQLGAIHLF
jgi:hypothetical protein